MTDETAPAPAPDETQAPEAEAKPKRKRGNRAPRKPSFKDWVRVIKSQGNGCDNKTVHLIINEATNVATLVTNAAKAEDSDEMEGERRQIFQITSFEVINVPEPVEEPEAAPPAPAPEG